MATDKPEAGDGDTAAPKKSKKLILAIPLVVVMAGVSAGAYFMTAGKTKAKECPAAEGTSTHALGANIKGVPAVLAAATKEEPTSETAPSVEPGSVETKDEKEKTFAEKCAEEAVAALNGPIVRLMPITMNLSDGRVLRVGLALQLIAEPEDPTLAAVAEAAAAGGGEGGGTAPTEIGPSPLGGSEAKALDAAIQYLGNSTYAALSAPGGRARASEELSAKVKEAYKGDIHRVLFTDFVMS